MFLLDLWLGGHAFLRAPRSAKISAADSEKLRRFPSQKKRRKCKTLGHKSRHGVVIFLFFCAGGRDRKKIRKIFLHICRLRCAAKSLNKSMLLAATKLFVASAARRFARAGARSATFLKRICCAPTARYVSSFSLKEVFFFCCSEITERTNRIGEADRHDKAVSLDYRFIA